MPRLHDVDAIRARVGRARVARWVRIEGIAAVHDDGALRDRALDALAMRYPPYRAARPRGPLLAVTPTGWAGRTAT